MKTTSIIYHQQPWGRSRKGSFFYDGHVATVSDARYKGIEIIIEIRGHKEITLHGRSYEGKAAVAAAFRKALTDKDIERLGRNDQLGNCNWFTLTIHEGENYSDQELVIDSIDEAVAQAKDLLDHLRKTYQDKSNPWVCRDCGSTNVEKQMWVNLNTNKITGDALEDNEGRCNSCEQWVRVVQLADYVGTEKETV